MIIFHLLPAVTWQAQAATDAYRAETLTTEGFIHCTREAERLVEVANRFYRQIPGEFVILCVETDRLQAEVRWEMADGQLFPHIYGRIVQEAIVDVVTFPRNLDGQFLTFTY